MFERAEQIEYPGELVGEDELVQLDASLSPEEEAAFAAELRRIEQAERDAWEDRRLLIRDM